MRSLPPSNPFLMSDCFSVITSAAMVAMVSRVCLIYLNFLVGRRDIISVIFSGRYSAMKMVKIWDLELLPNDWTLTEEWN